MADTDEENTSKGERIKSATDVGVETDSLYFKDDVNFIRR